MFNDLPTALRDCLNPGTLPGAATYALAFLVIAWLAGRVVRLAVHRILNSHIPRADPTIVKFLGQLARLAIYVVAILCYVYQIPVLRQLGGVGLTSVGIISVVVGLAAQSTLGNLISGVSLLLYRPFRLGDRLQVATPAGVQTGVVETLSLGYTTLLTDDRRTIIIPNSIMASQTSISLTFASQTTPAVITLTLAPTADLPKARALLADLVKSHAPAAQLESCRVTALSDTGVTLTLALNCPDPAAAAELKSTLLEALKSRLAAAGIPLAH